ncbi:MAG: four helix bundle protein [Deltaproteobacteria bacterium]|nr:four helix bundle protein [Deltaproteobacteria bacterium]
MGKPHHRLDVWKRSLDLVTRIYRVTAGYPEVEKFGLVSQMRRAAVSIPSNIAEGAGRSSGKQFAYFLDIAQGSVSELETQLLISRNLGFLASDQIKPLLQEMDEISRMLIGLKRSLK